ncbi:Uncharacterized protein FWK35_00013825 [Aphis craccivora]|uniref:Uncharacterized protein n=1 Tax=Aphis craccivora TaxID=307492 RepID=A0A6G0ZHR3_APHCR|nr:Uncharacterized protein FWK35_00013825 [Aphis craccivora]
MCIIVACSAVILRIDALSSAFYFPLDSPILLLCVRPEIPDGGDADTTTSSHYAPFRRHDRYIPIATHRCRQIECNTKVLVEQLSLKVFLFLLSQQRLCGQKRGNSMADPGGFRLALNLRLYGCGCGGGVGGGIDDDRGVRRIFNGVDKKFYVKDRRRRAASHSRRMHIKINNNYRTRPPQCSRQHHRSCHYPLPPTLYNFSVPPIRDYEFRLRRAGRPGLVNLATRIDKYRIGFRLRVRSRTNNRGVAEVTIYYGFHHTYRHTTASRKFLQEFLQDIPPPIIGPVFDKTVPNNVTGLVGRTAYLHCRVKNLGNRTGFDTDAVSTLATSTFYVPFSIYAQFISNYMHMKFQMANGEQTCAISNRVVLSVVRVLSSKLIFTGHNKIACPDAILNRTRQIIAFDVYQYRWHDHSCLQQLIVA